MLSSNGRIAFDYMTKHPAALGRRLGYDKLRDDLHGEWMKRMITAQEDITLQAHRGSYKTTCLCIVLAVLIATQQDKTIMFLRKTDDDVVQVIRQVARIINHEQFQRLTSWLYAKNDDEPTQPLKIVRGSSKELTCDNYAAPRGAVQLLGIGLGGSLTGKHADIIVTDDIINRLDRTSHAERERTKSIYQELQNILIPGGRFINSGTPWHVEDAFMLMPLPQRFDCYTTGMLDHAQIDKLRHSMQPSLFAANYELRHIASDNALFKEAPQFTDNAAFLRDGIAHIDAAYGGEDFTALTCANRIGDTIYIYGRLWQRHIDTVLDSALTDVQRMMCEPVYCETNADKGYLAKEIRRRGYQCRQYAEKQNKYSKIATYLRKWWVNIVFLRGTDEEYIRQILNYTEQAEHDDSPDSAACVCRILDRRE